MTQTAQPMTFEEFKKVLAEIVMVDEDMLTVETSFLNDLFIDSIRWLEMALALERLGMAISAESLWDVHTVGDAYQYYVTTMTSWTATP